MYNCEKGRRIFTGEVCSIASERIVAPGYRPWVLFIYELGSPIHVWHNTEVLDFDRWLCSETVYLLDVDDGAIRTSVHLTRSYFLFCCCGRIWSEIMLTWKSKSFRERMGESMSAYVAGGRVLLILKCNVSPFVSWFTTIWNEIICNVITDLSYWYRWVSVSLKCSTLYAKLRWCCWLC